MINIAVIGYGYWGPNLVRNFVDNPETSVLYICDNDSLRIKAAKQKYPFIKCTNNYKKLLNDENLHLIAIATPVSSHFNLALEALNAGKHVLLEKPMTTKVSEAERLINLAEKKGLKIFVDHTFIYTGAVRQLKTLLSSGSVGDIYYFDSVRVNLGLFQSDVNVIWDLAPHDFSIMDHLISEKPAAISAIGASRVQGLIEDIAYVTVKFRSGLLAHFHVNWLSPVKIRRIIIGGSQKMIVFDDLNPDEKIKVYDKGVTLIDEPRDKIYTDLIQYRIGDMYVPRIESKEALKQEVEHIVDCLKNNKKPITDGEAGLEVIRLLEATQESIKNNGKFIKLHGE